MIPRRLFPSLRELGCLVTALLALAANGCGKPVGNISGKVNYQGKPLPGGFVTFTCEGDTPTLKSSVVQPDGAYSIPAMPAGPVKISVQGVLGSNGPATKTGPGGTEPPGGGRKTVFVPPQYAKVETSELTYTVVSGSQTHDIELK